MRLVDSHCHIDGPKFEEDLDQVIERAKNAGVVAMLNVGTGSPEHDSFERTLELAEKYDCIFGSAGIHPHDASEYTEGVEERLRKLITSSDKMIAWGEIGLDFYYDHSPRNVQKRVFRKQIRAARELGLPIIIHSREANDETVEILSEECSIEGFAGGIMHCFGGTAEMAESLIPLGFMISFAGNVTFKNAEVLRSAAAVVPRDKLLIETDCPYLTPVPHRGKRNEPVYVADTARFLAEFYGEKPEAIAAQTTKNFEQFFGIEI
ncbi:MAG: TatD family deoxyribonuclease [Acidobacteria bacterium]|nr:MAG: TatD family deoxyribonuclease [Acidobacteriota bacterium]REK01542.1 MAG: TatD family deoxyribonuclease [Acidobacteriota bacterium]REK14498.1 MAG: TatD family deoxyribonuclease [Acidobacteriota bacterium]REK45213.1 MAG: TatD family deoxyribonuclease [Acidobacteriota bacterium]